MKNVSPPILVLDEVLSGATAITTEATMEKRKRKRDRRE